jgi:hypothetical protein
MVTMQFITKRCTRLVAASGRAYQLLSHGQWVSLATPVSSITKTGRHDIAEILLKVALSTKNQINQSTPEASMVTMQFILTADSHMHCRYTLFLVRN